MVSVLLFLLLKIVQSAVFSLDQVLNKHLVLSVLQNSCRITVSRDGDSIMIIRKYEAETENDAIMKAMEDLGKDAIVMNIQEYYLP